jgi:UPF0755 protein
MISARARLVLAVLGLAVLAVAAGGLWIYFGRGPAAPAGAATDVVLPPGAGVGGVARGLAAAHVIGSPWAFKLAAELTGAAHHLKAGEYEIPSRASVAEIIAQIRRGDVVRHRITIPEGLTSRDAAEVLRRTDYLVGDIATPPEGALLPETYDVRRGEPRAAVLRRMIQARDRLLEALWRSRARGLPYRTPEQAVVLASVVEKETALPAERPLVAAVFVNRLKKGMRLESDPTVIYGLTGGAPLGHGLRVSELASPTPYNTYLNAGLPPTPIANPGRAALAAALAPARSDALYFVADGSGGHVFADTFEAHQRNVAHWRIVERAGRQARNVQ